MLPFSSPFAEHVRTNYIPSHHDRPIISHLIADGRTRLSALDAEIQKLQEEYDRIDEVRNDVHGEVSGYRQLLAPIRRLPDAVLRSIFLHSLPTRHNAVVMVTEPPLVFGYVSRRWRDVAYRTPLLWASLHIGLAIVYSPGSEWGRLTPVSPSGDERAASRMESHCQTVRQWLARSGTCPLSISIDNRETFQLYFNAISEFSSRWRKLEVAVNTQAETTALASIRSASVPMLESLYLRFTTWGYDEGTSWQQTGLFNGGSLRTVHLTGSARPMNIIKIETNWAHITHLTLFDTGSSRKSTPEEACWIFNHCINLVQCTLAICEPMYATADPPWNLPPTTHFCLPHLQSLSVSDHYYFLAIILSSIGAPRLHTVAYSTQFQPSTSRQSPLAALLAHNGSSVRLLITDPRHHTFDDLTHCIWYTPSLSTFQARASPQGLSPHQLMATIELPILNIVMKPILVSLLSPIPVNAGQYCGWPLLHTLICDGAAAPDEEDVVQFVRRRMAASTDQVSSILPMKRVEVKFKKESQMDVSAMLDACIAAGLKLKLEYPEPRQNVLMGKHNPRTGINRGSSEMTFPLF